MAVSELKTCQIIFFLFLLVKGDSMSMRKGCYAPKLHFFFAFHTHICEKYSFGANFLIKKFCVRQIYIIQMFLFSFVRPKLLGRRKKYIKSKIDIFGCCFTPCRADKTAFFTIFEKNGFRIKKIHQEKASKLDFCEFSVKRVIVCKGKNIWRPVKIFSADPQTHIFRISIFSNIFLKIKKLCLFTWPHQNLVWFFQKGGGRDFQK